MSKTVNPPATKRGRLAPSPTGAQHVGNARTYLIAWLSARSQGAEVALRIEDIDSPRIKQGAAEQALDDLHWLGLDWDGEAIVQTQRLHHYETALEELKRKGLVYPCTCTRSDIAAAASAPHAEHEGPVYPGLCAHRSAKDAEGLATAGTPFAWRFRVNESPSFMDRFLGEVRIDVHQVGGDFVIWKSAGTPAYQLAVVVDDAAMGITEVVRGDDLVPSTPRQILLYRALGLKEPIFAHVPLVVGEDGRRLAKRHGDTRLSTLRLLAVRASDGVTTPSLARPANKIGPEELLGILACSCGWLAKPEPITARELVPLFRWDTIPKEPFVWRG